VTRPPARSRAGHDTAQQLLETVLTDHLSERGRSKLVGRALLEAQRLQFNALRWFPACAKPVAETPGFGFLVIRAARGSTVVAVWDSVHLASLS